METTRYLNEKEVARITGRALSTLRNERFNRKGIPFSKVGRSCLYCLRDVLNFMESHKVQTDLHPGQVWPRSIDDFKV